MKTKRRDYRVCTTDGQLLGEFAQLKDALASARGWARSTRETLEVQVWFDNWTWKVTEYVGG